MRVEMGTESGERMLVYLPVVDFGIEGGKSADLLRRLY